MADSNTLVIALILLGSTAGLILVRALLNVIVGQYLADRDSET